MKRKYYFRKRGRQFEICSCDTDQGVPGLKRLDTYPEACDEVNRLNRGN